MMFTLVVLSLQRVSLSLCNHTQLMETALQVSCLQTGHSKGFGWVEFEVEEVASIVCETMKNYLLFGKNLDVQLLPKEKVHPGALT